MTDQPSKVILVTGANRGLGLAITTAIASRNEPVSILATSRGGIDTKLQTRHPQSTVEYPVLDITDLGSIQRLKADVEAKYGRVDIIINNAAKAGEKSDNSTFTVEFAHDLLQSNYYAVIDVLAAFLPLLEKSQQPRIVNVSSTISQLTPGTPELIAALSKEQPSLEAYKDFGRQLEYAVSHPEIQDGFAKSGLSPIYGNIKFLLNHLTAGIAKKYPNIIANAGCPGLVATDMGSGPKFDRLVKKTPAQGAQVALQLAFDDLNGVSGAFWAGKTSAFTGPTTVIEPWINQKFVMDTVDTAA